MSKTSASAATSGAITEAAGIYLYQAGAAFVASTAEQLARERALDFLARGEQWWDRAAALSYWHEVDHFQTFACSPFLTFIGDMLEIYASTCTALIESVRDRGGWDGIAFPLAASIERHRPPLITERLVVSTKLRLSIDLLLNSPFLLSSAIERVNWATRVGLALKGAERRDDPLPSMGLFAVAPGYSVEHLLEASARLHELGHLSAWRATPGQIDLWRRSCLVGKYGSVLGPLLGQVDTDLIHMCTTLAFRAPFFPFSESNVALFEAHPVLRFQRLVDTLKERGLTRATGRDARSPDARSSFHDRVVAELVDEFGRVEDGSRFDESHRRLWGRMLSDPVAYQPDARRRAALEQLLAERAALADERAARLRLELDHLEHLASEPTLRPFSTILHDGVISPYERTPLPEEIDDGLAAHVRVGFSQALADVFIFGDSRLFGILAHAFGYPEDTRRRTLDTYRRAMGLEHIAWGSEPWHENRLDIVVEWGEGPPPVPRPTTSR